MTLCLIFSENNLLSSNQFVFRPGETWINQLLSINHEILTAFDMELKVHRIFIDISKALDKVWHDGLIFKLYQNGICGEMINILDRKRRIVLKGQCSSWVDIWAGVPQRSILRSLFFNIPQMIILSQLKDLMSLLSTFDLF